MWRHRSSLQMSVRTVGIMAVSLGLLALANSWSGTELMEDMVKVEGNDGDQNVVVLWIGTVDATCTYFTATRGTSVGVGGDATVEADCPNEVAVFSTDDPMITTQPGWTPGQQTATITLNLSSGTGPIEIPVMVWIHPGLVTTYADTASISTSDALVIWKNRLLWEVDQATRYFNGSATGITFDPIFISDDPNLMVPAATAAVGDNCAPPTALVTGAVPGLYTNGALNIYVVEAIPGNYNGRNCRENGFQNVMYISETLRSATTIAHELGHAFGLDEAGHTKGQPYQNSSYESDNIMIPGEVDPDNPERDTLTLGQAYRINVDHDSWLNRNVPTTLEGTEKLMNYLSTLPIESRLNKLQQSSMMSPYPLPGPLPPGTQPDSAEMFIELVNSLQFYGTREGIESLQDCQEDLDVDYPCPKADMPWPDQ